MLLKSAEGLRVLDHTTRMPIPDDGVEVEAVNGIPTDPYWAWMLRDGDVVEADAAPAAEPEQARPADDHKE